MRVLGQINNFHRDGPRRKLPGGFVFLAMASPALAEVYCFPIVSAESSAAQAKNDYPPESDLTRT
jgi:hypothetical protein